MSLSESLTFTEYEEEILRRMYDNEIIEMGYRPINIVRHKVGWLDLQQKYKIRKSFGSIIKKLENKGYVSSHGKSGDVCSLTKFGIDYVISRFGDTTA